jgi:hypothetical protein
VSLDLNCFSSQILDLSLRLNLDIFETNVINLGLVVSGLVYLGSDILSKALFERQQRIVIEFLVLVRRAYRVQVYASMARSRFRRTRFRTSVLGLRRYFYKYEGSRFRKLNSLYNLMAQLKIDSICCDQEQELMRLEQKDRVLMSNYVISRVLERTKSCLGASYHCESVLLKSYLGSDLPLRSDGHSIYVYPDGPNVSDQFPQLTLLPIVSFTCLGDNVYECVSEKVGVTNEEVRARLHREVFIAKMNCLVKSIKQDTFSSGRF